MFGSIPSNNNKRHMERFEYKGRTVDVFTAIKNGRWLWAFTVDEGLAQASKSGDFDSAPTAAHAAMEEARRRIDEQS
jgi:hypothetical protein